MEIKISIEKIDADNLHPIKMLFENCKWDWVADAVMLESFRGSFKVFKAEVDGKLVGFGRIITDGKIYGLLVDLMVDPNFRSKGIGLKLTDFIVNQCSQDGLKVIQLISTTEGKGVYLKSGFKECSAESPGMIKFLSPIVI